MNRRILNFAIFIAWSTSLSHGQFVSLEKNNRQPSSVWVIKSEEEPLDSRKTRRILTEGGIYNVRVINVGEDIPQRSQLDRWRGAEKPDYIICTGTKSLHVAEQIADGETVIAMTPLPNPGSATYNRTVIIDARPHPESVLSLLRTHFPRVQTVGVVCSKMYRESWGPAAEEAAERLGFRLDICVVANAEKAKDVVKEKISSWDVLWVVPDPEILDSAHRVRELFDIAHKACRIVVTYSSEFAPLNPALIIEADEETATRQAAAWIRRNKVVEGVVTLPPVGTRVILNLREPLRCGVEWNSDAIDTVNVLIR